MTARQCECSCLGCKYFCGQDAPVDGHPAHHARLLVALDRSVAAAALARGIPACDGLDLDAPCDIGIMHSVAAEVAIAFAAMIDEPTVVAHEHLEDKMLKFSIELERRFAGHPKKERTPS